ncbi:tetratricopeptide repeat protein [Psychrobacter sp. H8-1]|uniref:tetratricopeptide repeat protein n=1 Tax=Psychrobacter sp. H8-1 TaxID=2774129 RepID=UPI0027DA4F6D|nr:tetratricopeptide repeat protein [Psychrobacter sp. H8-1]
MPLFKNSFISKTTIFLVAAMFSVSAIAMDFRQNLRLANQGNASAQYNLGVMYYKGKGVQKNNAKAVEWFKQAAKQGHTKSQYNLEIMYSNGESAHPYKIASQGIPESVPVFVHSPATAQAIAQAEADIKEAQAAGDIEIAQDELDDNDRLKRNSGNMYIYKDRAGQVLLTNTSPSGNFDKFAKKIKTTSYKDAIYRDVEKDREREWERQLNKKPDARIGMSHKQVLSDTNWGRPKDVRTTIDASGTLERWMYSSTHSLYFKGGKLIKIEK